MQLTNKQMNVLTRLCEPGIVSHGTKYKDRQVLLNAKLVKTSMTKNRGHMVEITELGKQYVELSKIQIDVEPWE